VDELRAAYHTLGWQSCTTRSGRATDPATSGFWLVDDYFPEIVEIDRPIFPAIEDLGRALGKVEIHTLPIPHDCVDGFLGAYWRRPHAYLDAGVRRAISTFAKIRTLEPGLTRLRRDLEDGTWERRSRLPSCRLEEHKPLGSFWKETR
jgi:hypothetical protein